MIMKKNKQEKRQNVSFERTVEIMNTNLYTGINSPSITSKKNKERKKNQ